MSQVFFFPPTKIDSLPLPAGAATEAKQDTGNASLSAIESQTADVATATKQDTGNASLSAIKSQTADVATATKQDTGNSSLSTIASNTSDVATATKQDTGNSSLSTIASNTSDVATATKQDTGNSSLSTIASNTSDVATATNQTEILARLSGSLVPEAFDEIVLTYVTTGNGIGQVETTVYKLASVTVKTVTMSYDGSDRLSGVVAS